MDLDRLAQMKTYELREFLCLRGRKKLSLEPFGDLENDALIVHTVERVEAEMGRKYGAKLRIGEKRFQILSIC